MHSEKMTLLERRTIFSLSSIMSLRMIGLFMVLPIFALYAQQLIGSTPTLIGLAMGIYGLAQAIFQIPFGVLSDHFGRKPIILSGLILFILGSLLAGYAHSISLMLIGRTLQGMGAIGSTILALMADLTREEQRTKAMAISGISIGFSFSIAMFIGPLLTKWISVNELFFLAAFFGLIALSILYFFVPTPRHSSWHRDTEPEFTAFFKLLLDPALAKLNIGILILHATFTACFVVIPIRLHAMGFLNNQQWHLYLPILIGAFFVSIICIGMAERKRQLKPYFIAGIILLLASFICLWQATTSSMMAMGLFLFFSGFTLLEAFLPSLISRTAPASRKGSALGIYSCAQFFGIFLGGIMGGWLYGKFHFAGTYLFCMILMFFWLVLALLMQPPRYLATQMWRIPSAWQNHWDKLSHRLQMIPGIVEVTFIADDGIAYLKMEREAAKHPDLLYLKEQLQSNNPPF